MTIWRRCSLTKSTVCSTSTANLSVFKSFRVILAATQNLRGGSKDKFDFNTEATAICASRRLARPAARLKCHWRYAGAVGTGGHTPGFQFSAHKEMESGSKCAPL